MCRNGKDLLPSPVANPTSTFQEAHRGGVEVHGGGREGPSVRPDRKNHPQTCGGAPGWDRASAVERWEHLFWFSTFCNRQTQ